MAGTPYQLGHVYVGSMSRNFSLLWEKLRRFYWTLDIHTYILVKWVWIHIFILINILYGAKREAYLKQKKKKFKKIRPNWKSFYFQTTNRRRVSSWMYLRTRSFVNSFKKFLFSFHRLSFPYHMNMSFISFYNLLKVSLRWKSVFVGIWVT